MFRARRELNALPWSTSMIDAVRALKLATELKGKSFVMPGSQPPLFRSERRADRVRNPLTVDHTLLCRRSRFAWLQKSLFPDAAGRASRRPVWGDP